MKNFIGSLLLILSVTLSHAQVRLAQAEYFWDTDPGQGNAIAVAAADGNFNSALETLLNNAVGYPAVEGLHTFNIRIKDSQNQWGPVFKKIVVLDQTMIDDLRVLSEAEYFWDNDPGQGNANALIASDGNFNSALESVLQDGLPIAQPSGKHVFYMRLKDSNGVWGPAFGKVIFIETICTTPTPTASAQTLCTTATVANLTAVGTNLKWYSNAIGGVALTSQTVLATGTYYVSQTIDNCESARTEVAVTINSEVNPSDVNATVLSPTTATVSWTVLSAPSSGYDFYYSTSSTPPVAGTIPSGTTNTLTAALSGLSPDTTYYFWVRSNCGATSGNWAETSFTTFAVGCNAPSGLTATGITAGGATLNWTAADPAPSNGYQYYYSTANTPPTASTTPSGNTSTTSAPITGLNANTVYYYWVRSNCGTSLGSWVAGSTFTTLGTSNDTCAGALSLVTAATFNAGAVTGTLLNASTTEGIVPSCQELYAADVWYQVVVPASGSVTIETKAAATNSATDTVLAAFTGSCDSLTQIGCNDDKVPTSDLFSLISLTGQAPGALIHIAVWKYDTAPPTAGTSEFQVAAYDATLASSEFETSKFNAYPNPVTDYLNVSNDKIISKIALFNMIGQEVFANYLNSTETRVDMSPLAQGTYLLKVTSDNQTVVIKVLKQ